MIDFRYHLVSIVAVFLALATGLVIGATSLQDQVAGTLQGQVTQLRGEKQGLRNQLDQSGEAGRRQDQFVTDVTPQVVRGQLARRNVVVITLPGTPDALVRSTEDTLRKAGATVTGRVEVDESWIEGSQTERTAALRRAASEQGTDPQAVPANRLGGLVLAEAVSVRQDNPGDRAANPGLDVLVQAGLVNATPDTPRRADSAVVLWPGLSAPDGENRVVPAWADLVTALGLSGRPVVGVSNGTPDPATGAPDGLVSALRDSAEVSGAMSTIDAGARPVGQVAMVLALREEYAGRSGHYGLDKDASAVAPKVAAP